MIQVDLKKINIVILEVISKYDSAVKLSDCTVSDDDYNKIMQSLNVKQNELCNHVIHGIQKREEPKYIFFEGGAGVGKTQVAK